MLRLEDLGDHVGGGGLLDAGGEQVVVVEIPRGHVGAAGPKKLDNSNPPKKPPVGKKSRDAGVGGRGNASSNAATKVGNITLNAGETPVAFAQKKRANPTVVGLTASRQFFTFRYLQPTTISNLSTAFTLAANEELIGMDYSTNTVDPANRPQSLYVLTSSNLFQTNNSTAPSSLMPARVLSGGTALDNSVDYSVDFNPANGGLRVVGSDDSNRAITITSTTTAPSTTTSKPRSRFSTACPPKPPLW